MLRAASIRPLANADGLLLQWGLLHNDWRNAVFERKP